MDAGDADFSGGVRFRGASLSSTDNQGGISDHHTSIDDYNRVMLQYTQRQMMAFTNHGNMNERHNSSTSRSSGQSNTSSMTNMVRDGNGPSPPRSGDGTPGDAGRV
jgi:hypothetical protein